MPSSSTASVAGGPRSTERVGQGGGGEDPDRRDVRAGRAQQVEAVRLCLGRGLFVGEHATFGDRECAEDAAGGAGHAELVGAGHFVGVEHGFVRHENARVNPLVETLRGGGVHVTVGAGHFDVDRVVWAAILQRLLLGRTDHVVGRRDDIAEDDAVRRVAKTGERYEPRHGACVASCGRDVGNRLGRCGVAWR